MTNLIIKGKEKTLSNDGTKEYWKIKTDQGQMSCWKDEIANSLDIEKSYDCEVQINGKYKTIRANNGQIDKIASTAAATVKPAQAFNTSKQDELYEKRVGTMTSYSKDIFVELLKIYPTSGKIEEDVNGCMEMAIRLVKQAKKAFE